MGDAQHDSRTIEENTSTQPPPNDNQPTNGTPEVTDPSGSNQDEFTALSLQLQALEKQKEILAKQLTVQQNALNQANQLAEARRKVAAMQAEIDRMEKKCANTQTNHEQQPPPRGTHQNEIHNIRTNYIHQDHYVPPSAGMYDPNSPLSAALQHTPWPLGYKPQLPRYNGSEDPTQFIMTYEATIASAGGDGPIMAKSFIMACEGPVANWYSHQPSGSITSWPQLKASLRQDFQGFGRLDPNTIKNFQCLQGDKEPLYDYFRRFVQKKALIPNFPEKDAIAKCIAPLLPGQLASHLSREPPRTLSVLYAEVEKYARSDAYHRRRVEQRRIMRQAEKNNWNYQNKNPQFVFPVEPSQETSPEQEQDQFTTPPNKSPEAQQNNQGRNHPGHKGRGHGRGRGKGCGPSNGPRKLFCHFHGSDSDHTTNFCPEKKRTLECMEEEKKAKLVNHTTLSGPSAPHFPPTPALYNPTFQPTPAFSYNPYPNN